MSQYEARISKNADGEFYALIVRIDRDGQASVIHGYKGRHFATMKAAKKSTDAYISKMYATNPARRIGTAHPKRKSEATKKTPTKRLVARRKRNTKAGYYPNPIDLHAEFLIMLHLALARFKKAKTHQQAHVSYLQGLIDGGTGTHILTSSEATDWYQQIQSGVNKK